MTISEDATKNTSVSKAYVKNAQVVVMKADKAGEYTRVEDLSKLTFAAENGSAGEAALKELSYNTTGVTAQSDALMEVASGSTRYRHNYGKCDDRRRHKLQGSCDRLRAYQRGIRCILQNQFRHG